VSDIKVGDLVMVVRPIDCCGHTQGLGRVFIVEFLRDGMNICMTCGHRSAYSVDAWYLGSNLAFPLQRLKRIPPLDELERDQIVDELTCG
jgi:hypothetical protein